MILALPSSHALLCPECPQSGSPVCRTLFPSQYKTVLSPQGLLVIPPGCYCSLCTKTRIGMPPKKLRTRANHKPRLVNRKLELRAIFNSEYKKSVSEPNYARDSIVVSFNVDSSKSRYALFHTEESHNFEENWVETRPKNSFSYDVAIHSHRQAFLTQSKSERWSPSLSQQNNLRNDCSHLVSTLSPSLSRRESISLSYNGTIYDYSQNNFRDPRFDRSFSPTNIREPSFGVSNADLTVGSNSPPDWIQKVHISDVSSLQQSSLEVFNNVHSQRSILNVRHVSQDKDSDLFRRYSSSSHRDYPNKHLYGLSGDSDSLLGREGSFKLNTNQADFRSCVATELKALTAIEAIAKGNAQGEFASEIEVLHIPKESFSRQLLPPQASLERMSRKWKSWTYRPPNTSDYIFLKPVTADSYSYLRKRARSRP